MSLSDWHRQQHKKQQHKNKATRIAQRDATVVQTKTSASIQHEIKDIFKHHRNAVKDESVLPHGVKSKLDRLRKELRLVQEQEKKQQGPSHPPTTTRTDQSRAPSQQHGSTLFNPLLEQHPQVSVYYDALLNPYGAPPPGQPMLYHRRGGGVTMQWNEAWIPTNPNLVLPTLPPHDKPQTQSTIPHSGPPQSRSVPPFASQPPPPPPPPLPIPPKKGGTDPNKQSGGKPHQRRPSVEQPEVIMQHRPRRKILNVWAENDDEEEEALIEQHLDDELTGDNTSTAKDDQHQRPTDERRMSDHDPSSVASSLWYYRDTSDHIQGPFSLEQMIQWIQAGFFPGNTPVRASHTDPWSTLGQVNAFSDAFGGPATDTTVNDVANLVGTDMPQHEHSDNDDDDEEQQSVQARIEALKSSSSSLRQANPQTATATSDQAPMVAESPGPKNDGDSVSARIMALKAQRERELSQISNHEESLQSLHVTNVNGTDRPEQQLPLPPPPPPPPPPPRRRTESPEDDLPMYPTLDNIDEDNDAGEQLAYPLPDESDHQEQTEDYDYPASGAYPINDDDDEEDQAYPVTDLHPDKEEDNPMSMSRRPLPTKQQAQVDKEVVSLLPIHLRKRRRTEEISKSSQSSKMAKLISQSNGTSHDDLEQLFTEVGDI